MKKVLFTATVDSHILHFHTPFLKMFKDNGYEVHVATNGNEKIPYCDVKHVISFQRKPIRINNIKAIKQLKKVIDTEKFDIIHTHTPMGAVVTRLAAKKARKKYHTRVIYTAHGFHFYKGAPLLNWLIYYPIEWYLAKYTDTLITINKEDFERAKKKFSKRCKDIQYVPGVGIDTKKFEISMSEIEKNELKKSLGLKENSFILTCVARLDKNKNQGFLINVMNQLVKEHNDIHLLLVGPDELNGYYQEMTRKYGLNSNIHFLGKRDDIPQLLHISNVVVSASKREGLPVNVLEALTCEIPVVAYDCRGIRDLIQNEENGYIITNVIEMIDRIKLLYNYTKKSEYGIINNNITKAEKYSLKKILEMMEKIYLRKKTVLHILNTNELSGAENVVCTIIKNMDNNYKMIYCSPNGPISQKLKEENIIFSPLKKLSYKEVKKTIETIKPDIIHAHDNRATVIASLFSKKYKIISHIHGNNIIMNSFNAKSFLFYILAKRVDKVIWVSDSALNNYYFKKSIINKSVVLYNVVNQKDILDKSNEFECNKVFDLIFLGRLAYPKNPERLIEIMRIIKRNKENISLAIVGDGVERKNIENLAYEYELEDNITFYGFQKNPYPILKNAKILIMTSIYEGTPMAALEAQALDKPIIATPVDGLKKIIINDYNGFLSDNNEVLANKILEILNNNDNFTNNVKKAFIKTNDIYSYINILDKLYN